MSMIFSDSDAFLHQSLAQLQNKIAALNINSELKKSISNDLKQIEQLILLKQHKLSFLSERNVLGVIAWNTAFEITDWNNAAYNIFGYTKQEVLGRHAAGLLVPENARSQVDKVMAALLKQEGGTDNINNNFTKDGRNITCKWYNLPVTDLEGNVIGVLSTVEDITANKAMEIALNRSEARFKKLVENVPGMIYQFRFKRTQSQLIQNEKMSSLGQLVAGVAHEINNPVNFIYGNLAHAQAYTENLLDLFTLYNKHYPEPSLEIQSQAQAIDLDFLLDDLPKLYTSMQIGANRIREIVTSLRTFLRLDEAECKEANIHEGIDSTLMILEHRLKAKQNRPAITVIKEYGNLPLVECYAGQLNQVFMNLIANAIDAVEEEMKNKDLQCFTPCIRICTKISKSNKIIISIADNGMGIPEKIKHRLFDPFYTTKPVGKGTAMGLSISYQIVTERHGGSLKCISEEGKGAEFIITIPVSAKA